MNKSDSSLNSLKLNGNSHMDQKCALLFIDRDNSECDDVRRFLESKDIKVMVLTVVLNNEEQDYYHICEEALNSFVPNATISSLPITLIDGQFFAGLNQIQTYVNLILKTGVIK